MVKAFGLIWEFFVYGTWTGSLHTGQIVLSQPRIGKTQMQDQETLVKVQNSSFLFSSEDKC